MTDNNEPVDHVDDDFEFARKTYYDLLVKGSEALEEMMEVARATEHPRAFEVLSGMMKNVADVNGNLLDLHKKKKEYNKEDALKELPQGTTNNNLFVGSTSDLQRMLLSKDSDDEQDNVVDISEYTSDK
jgi:hypothetical protein|tara:strand:- start:48433 stop:48819 length:387 start_codon:yes stop_codon:yes gene_type:complete